ncbi:MAG: hypothetical protein IRZ13_05630 [Acetobacteraceae bacterium]|nr:hypothetical protein [Acetobacteraceae bacterium]
MAAQFLSLVFGLVGQAFNPGGGTADTQMSANGVPLPSTAAGGRYSGGPVEHRFAGGGVVPGVPVGRDTVPARLSPFEYVVSARGHALVGTEVLDQINRGQLAAVKTVPAGAAIRVSMVGPPAADPPGSTDQSAKESSSDSTLRNPSTRPRMH